MMHLYRKCNFIPGSNMINRSLTQILPVCFLINEYNEFF